MLLYTTTTDLDENGLLVFVPVETKEFVKSDTYNPSSSSYMKFNASFCDPLRKDVVELGQIDGSKAASLFRTTPWVEHLEKMNGLPENKIYYSPSLCVETHDGIYGISISAVGVGDRFEFYIFYRRPKLLQNHSLIWSQEVFEQKYITRITGQISQDVVACLTALAKGDLAYLERTVK